MDFKRLTLAKTFVWAGNSMESEEERLHGQSTLSEMKN